MDLVVILYVTWEMWYKNFGFIIIALRAINKIKSVGSPK